MSRNIGEDARFSKQAVRHRHGDTLDDPFPHSKNCKKYICSWKKTKKSEKNIK